MPMKLDQPLHTDMSVLLVFIIQKNVCKASILILDRLPQIRIKVGIQLYKISCKHLHLEFYFMNVFLYNIA